MPRGGKAGWEDAYFKASNQHNALEERDINQHSQRSLSACSPQIHSNLGINVLLKLRLR